MILARTACFRALTALALTLAAVGLSGCLGGGTLPHLKPIPAAAQARLAKLGMTQEAPILLRIFKEEAELEIWKKKDGGRYHHFKTYPICFYSGELGPKVEQGDKQAPEGFYTVRPAQMNPNSDFHLSFNLGYPNRYDAAHGRTGAHLMVHGQCSSAGCYAMTDALIEEIYAIAREAFEGGQRAFQVHAFPFRMTDANMRRHGDSRWYGFWQTLKAGYEAFEQTRVQPSITVCEKRYLVNAEFLGDVVKPDPDKACPPHRKLDPETILARLESERPSAQSARSSPVNDTPRSAATRTAAATGPDSETAARDDSGAPGQTPRPVLAASTVPDESAADGADARDEADAPPAEEGEAGIRPARAADNDPGPWIVPEGTPAAKKDDRETRRSTPRDGSST